MIVFKKKSFKERLIETFGVNPFICTSCGNEIDQFKPRRIVDTDESDQMPELVCPNCRSKFEYKKTDDR